MKKKNKNAWKKIYAKINVKICEKISGNTQKIPYKMHEPVALSLEFQVINYWKFQSFFIKSQHFSSFIPSFIHCLFTIFFIIFSSFFHTFYLPKFWHFGLYSGVFQHTWCYLKQHFQALFILSFLSFVVWWTNGPCVSSGSRKAGMWLEPMHINLRLCDGVKGKVDHNCLSLYHCRRVCMYVCVCDGSTWAALTIAKCEQKGEKRTQNSGTAEALLVPCSQCCARVFIVQFIAIYNLS